MYAIREAAPADVHAVAALLCEYMRETYNDEWRGSVNWLLQDGFGARCISEYRCAVTTERIWSAFRPARTEIQN